MNDLIKRISDAKEMIERKPNQSTVDYTIYGVLTDCDIMLKSQQAEIERLKERVPKKGEWLQTDKPDITAAWHPHCSVCGKEVTNHYAFCPFCGTDMRDSYEYISNMT